MGDASGPVARRYGRSDGVVAFFDECGDVVCVVEYLLCIVGPSRFQLVVNGRSVVLNVTHTCAVDIYVVYAEGRAVELGRLYGCLGRELFPEHRGRSHGALHESLLAACYGHIELFGAVVLLNGAVEQRSVALEVLRQTHGLGAVGIDCRHYHIVGIGRTFVIYVCAEAYVAIDNLLRGGVCIDKLFVDVCVHHVSFHLNAHAVRLAEYLVLGERVYACVAV